MLKEEASCGEAVYDIVQRFISDIGIPTIERYERSSKHLWKLPPPAECPQPLSQHGIFPRAWPPNSSCFIYHGRKPAIISDDDNDNDLITPHQHLSCVENEGSLKAELMWAKGRIVDLESGLNDSCRREQELLEQIGHLTAATPNRHRSVAFNQKSPHTSPVPAELSTEYGMFIEGPNLDDKFQIRHPVPRPGTPRTPNRHRTLAPAFSQQSPQVHSPLRHKTFSPAPTATTEYGSFIELYNLDDMFPVIDIICRKVTMYLWHDELLNAGMPEDLLPQLKAVMSSNSNPS